MEDFNSSLWNFVNWDSIWPLPHVLLAYHAYMYSRNWVSVLCFYYLLKTFQLLLFSSVGSKHQSFFSELLNPGRHAGGVEGDESNLTRSCLVDFNGLFVGGTIQTSMGILLGMVHSYLCAPSIYDVKSFHPVTFWKSPATKHSKKFKNAKEFVEKRFSLHDIGFKYGLWPPQQIFGIKIQTIYEPRTGFENLIHPIPEWFKLHTDEESIQVYRRWKFRKIFWKRWVQLTFLGTPAILFYTIDGRNDRVLRAGSLLYGFVTCSLLLLYKEINQNIYLNHIIKNQEREGGGGGGGDEKILRESIVSPYTIESKKENLDIFVSLFLDNMNMTFNSYDVIYSVWIGTCVTLIAFQAIPIFTTFYRVMFSVFLILFTNLSWAYFFKFLPCLSIKRENENTFHPISLTQGI